MKRLSFFILILSLVLLLFSEDKELDLKSVTIKDVDLIKDLNALALEYLDDTPEITIKYSTQALELSRKFQKPYEECNSLNYIGMANQSLKNFDKALEVLNKAMSIARHLESQAKIAFTLKNIAGVYFEKNDYNTALDYYHQSLKIENELNDFVDIAKLFNIIGSIYKIKQDYRKAKEYYQKAALIEENYIKENVMEIYYKRYQLYLATNDNENALIYLQKYSTLKDSLEKRLNMNKYENLEMKYEQEKKTEISQKDKTIKVLESVQKEHEIESKRKFDRLIKEKKEQDNKLEDIRNKAEMTEQELEILMQEKKIKELQIAKQRYFIIGFILFSLFLIVIAFVIFNQYKTKKRSSEELRKINTELNEAYEKLDHLARTDPLTALSNRRDMMERLVYEKGRFDRSNKSFVMVMSDIDDFKSINDNYGHDAGDFVLVTTSKLMKSTIRKQDIVARWGGEEFLFFLPDTEIVGGRILSEKIRQKIEETEFEYQDKIIPVSLTFGVCEFNKSMTIDQCITKADLALYEGKKQGKNCVIAADV